MKTLTLLFLSLFLFRAEASAKELTPLNLKADRVTVSGISSGAFMASQLHMAHSSLIKGAGLVAGGLYGCAIDRVSRDDIKGTSRRALNQCLKNWPRLEPVTHFTDLARDFASKGWIDDLDHLNGAPVYIFTGQADTRVPTDVVKLGADVYRTLGARVTYLDRLPGSREQKAGHAWLVADSPIEAGRCEGHDSPFINDCGYDQAEAILKLMYGDLAPRTPSNQLSGTLMEFDQQPFIAGGQSADDIGMGEDGFIYVPAACLDTSGPACELHVAFHGCKQSVEWIDDDFVTGTGLNEWADRNRIVVLYPQAAKVSFFKAGAMANPNSCWNWWGYVSDTAFPVKAGQQISTIKAMIDRVIGQ